MAFAHTSLRTAKILDQHHPYHLTDPADTSNFSSRDEYFQFRMSNRVHLVVNR